MQARFSQDDGPFTSRERRILRAMISDHEYRLEHERRVTSRLSKAEKVAAVVFAVWTMAMPLAAFIAALKGH